MKNEVELAVYNLVKELVENLNYEFVDVTYKKDEYGNNLTVYIDSENGIKISDCEIVSRAIDEPIDKLNPTKDEQYFLNVSSWGIDKPLTRLVQYSRRIGEEVELVYLDKETTKTIKATIKAVDNNEIIFNKKGVLVKVNFKDILLATPILKF